VALQGRTLLEDAGGREGRLQGRRDAVAVFDPEGRRQAVFGLGSRRPKARGSAA